MTKQTDNFNRSTMLISVLINSLNSTLLIKTVLWLKIIQVSSKTGRVIKIPPFRLNFSLKIGIRHRNRRLLPIRHDDMTNLPPMVSIFGIFLVLKLIIKKPYSPTKSLVPPTILVRVRCRVRVLEYSGRNKRFGGRLIGRQF